MFQEIKEDVAKQEAFINKLPGVAWCGCQPWVVMAGKQPTEMEGFSRVNCSLLCLIARVLKGLECVPLPLTLIWSMTDKRWSIANDVTAS